MDYGYCRCSTSESKQDIDRQRRMLRKLNIPEENIYWEYISGKSTEKTQWNRLLSAVQPGDVVYSTEVSRITRSTKQLCEVIEQAKEKQIKLVLGTLVVDCTDTGSLDPMTQGMLLMFGVFAELDASLIAQRVKSGLENARSKGVKLGRPSSTIENLPENFLRHYMKHKNGDLTLTELARLCGISRQTAHKYRAIYEGSAGHGGK